VSAEVLFGIELAVSGLLVGVMYSLIALGFVLIYKASGVFNFAQGSMTLFAALAVVGFLPAVGLWPAVILAILVMAALAVAVERVVLRPLVGRPPLAIFMATIGLAFVLEGLAQMIWGTQPKGLELGIPPQPFELAGVYIGRADLIAAAGAGLLVLVLVWFFQKTMIGLGLRAASDDHEAGLSVGIPLRRVWAITWTIAGIVAVAAGIIWGNRLGVHFAVSLIAFKALPVIIIGGAESIPGAILAGLIVGASENLAEGFIGPHIGGGVKDFFPYLLAILFLVVRPYGLFGREIIERV
jgi:branched-chain amino acid transport system permease protein